MTRRGVVKACKRATMHPRSAKYFRSATLVLGPNESIMELGEVGIGEVALVCPGGDPGTLLVFVLLLSISCPSMSKAGVCWMARIEEKLELDETALALLDTIGPIALALCKLMGEVLAIIPAPENEWSP